MTNAWKKKIEAATVHLPTRAGQGVLVPGGFVLTAAHCVEWYLSGGMVLGDHCLEIIRTRAGKVFKAEVYAVEPVADIAVLGKADNQKFYDDAEAFEEFCETTDAVRVNAAPLAVGQSLPVQVLTHHKTWIEATVRKHGGRLTPLLPSLFIETDDDIESGTSGSPIVDKRGCLVGLVSNGTRAGTIPCPRLALPRWVWRRIRDAQRPAANVAEVSA